MTTSMCLINPWQLNAQAAATTTLVTVASDTESKKIWGKGQTTSSLPLFLRNSQGTHSEEVEEARNRGSFLAPLPNFLGIPAFFSSSWK